MQIFDPAYNIEYVSTNVVRYTWLQLCMKKHSIQREDFPALYLIASDVSGDAQKFYVNLIKANLFFLFIGAALSAFTITEISEKIRIGVASLLFLLASTLISIIIQLIHKEKDWYGGRAIAESIKTLTWRYIMCAKPYENTSSIEKIDKKFIKHIGSILKDWKDISGALSGYSTDRPHITDQMHAVRKLSTKQRKGIYMTQRIKNQRNWYNLNAKKNKNKEHIFFIITSFSQFFAVISSFILILKPDQIVNVTGVFSTLAASLLAWMQVKRYQELTQSYGLAAQELGLIYEEGAYVQSDRQLSAFIMDAENAISREHTLWIARKNNP